MTGLAGKRVLVTAGGSGIGKATAKAFLAEGARVWICDIDDSAIDTFKSEQPGLGGVVADVSDEASVAALFDAMAQDFDGLDILVNNAGTAGPVAPVEEMDYDGWQACFDVNLGGAFLCARSAIPLIKAAGGGCIINLSSTAGLFGFPNRAPYCAAKWGIIGFTKTLAMELGTDGIRVNAICPGTVEGERMERVMAGEHQATGTPIEDIRRAYVECTSMKTWVTAQDMANTIVFLCSDKAARISGQAIPVDGHSESVN